MITGYSDPHCNHEIGKKFCLPDNKIFHSLPRTCCSPCTSCTQSVSCNHGTTILGNNLKDGLEWTLGECPTLRNGHQAGQCPYSSLRRTGIRQRPRSWGWDIEVRVGWAWLWPPLCWRTRRRMIRLMPKKNRVIKQISREISLLIQYNILLFALTYFHYWPEYWTSLVLRSWLRNLASEHRTNIQMPSTCSVPDIWIPECLNQNNQCFKK